MPTTSGPGSLGVRQQLHLSLWLLPRSSPVPRVGWGESYGIGKNERRLWRKRGESVNQVSGPICLFSFLSSSSSFPFRTDKGSSQRTVNFRNLFLMRLPGSQSLSIRFWGVLAVLFLQPICPSFLTARRLWPSFVLPFPARLPSSLSPFNSFFLFFFLFCRS